MTSSLVVIGIDSLDPHVLDRLAYDLPTFRNLKRVGRQVKLNSVFPVDTIPAWASIHTGLLPANHGLLYVYDIFDPLLGDLRKLDVGRIRGKTFWDYAGRAGKRSVIIFPMLVYPTWETNGIVIGKSPFDRRTGNIVSLRDVCSSPAHIMEEYDIPTVVKDVWGGYPGLKALRKWSEIGKECLLEEAAIGLKLMEREKWDLFFIYFHNLDVAQHRLWRFFDDSDPAFKNDPVLRDEIPDYYRTLDGIIKRMMTVKPDSDYIIVSDHGHISRPMKTVNINEHFRREGLLSVRRENSPRNTIARGFKTVTLRLVTALDLEGTLLKVVTSKDLLTRLGKDLYSSSHSIDTIKSKAKLSTFAGIKSYSYGGVEINRELVSDSEQDALRSRVKRILQGLSDPLTGSPLFEWVSGREEQFPGTYSDQIFPDILFQLSSGYCVGWDLERDLIGAAADHKVASGGHGKDATFLVLSDRKTSAPVNELNLVDVAPTILDLLGVNRDSKLDGRSMFAVDADAGFRERR